MKKVEITDDTGNIIKVDIKKIQKTFRRVSFKWIKRT